MVLGRVGEAGRRDRAERLACLSLAGLSWPTTGLSLGSPRRWEGARTSAGGWGTPRDEPRSLRPQKQQGARPGFPPLVRLPMRRTASVRCVLAFALLVGFCADPRLTSPLKWPLSSLHLRAHHWPPVSLEACGVSLVASGGLDDQPSWPREGRNPGPPAALGRLERAAGRPETVVDVPSLPESLFNTNALRHETRWSTKRAPPNRQR